MLIIKCSRDTGTPPWVEVPFHEVVLSTSNDSFRWWVEAKMKVSPKQTLSSKDNVGEIHITTH